MDGGGFEPFCYHFRQFRFVTTFIRWMEVDSSLFAIISAISTLNYLYPNGWRWIRTTEAICSRFTVCPLWPLGNPSIFFLFDGTNRARTYDPLLVRQMLSQLSYDPIQTTQKRLELSTSAVTGRRSNQLSHWAIFN